MAKTLRIVFIASGLVASVLTSAAATRLKPMMNDWKADVRLLEAALAGTGGFDAVEVKRALDAFAAGADEVAARIHPRSAEAADVKARFSKFAETSRAASNVAASRATFVARYADIRAQCRSRHAVYAN